MAVSENHGTIFESLILKINAILTKEGGHCSFNIT